MCICKKIKVKVLNYNAAPEPTLPNPFQTASSISPFPSHRSQTWRRTPEEPPRLSNLTEKIYVHTKTRNSLINKRKRGKAGPSSSLITKKNISRVRVCYHRINVALFTVEIRSEQKVEFETNGRTTTFSINYVELPSCGSNGEVWQNSPWQF